MSKTAGGVIKNTVNGIYMTGLIARKGWSNQQAADAVFEWLTNGSKVSLYDFMEAK